MNGFSIVIPVYNEERNINSLLEEIINKIDPNILYEIICVDDGSSDNSLKIVKNFQSIKNINVLNHKKNLGQSKAIFTGINNSKYNDIITIDGDGQNDPYDINKLLDVYMNNKDCLVSGIREKRKDSFKKIISSIVANKVRSYILKDRCKDSACGLKVFKKNIFLSFPYFDGIHRFLPSLFIGFGYGVKYMPITHRERLTGVSKYGTFDRLFKGIKDMIKVKKIINKRKIKNA